MKREKILSLMVAAILSFGQVMPVVGEIRPAYASSEEKTREKLDKKLSFKLTQDRGKFDYYDSTSKDIKWTLEIKNEAKADNPNDVIYLGEISNEDMLKNSSVVNSKNTRIRYVEYDSNKLKNYRCTVSYKDRHYKTISKKIGTDVNSFGIFTTEQIGLKLTFDKGIPLAPQETFKITFTTEVYTNDYDYPYDKSKWLRAREIGPDDKVSLLNTKHNICLKGQFYLDPDKKKPINTEDLVDKASFNDEAYGSYFIDCKNADLNFGENGKVLRQINKRDTENFENLTDNSQVAMGDTLRFISQIKIKNLPEDYKKLLKRSRLSQYLIKPRFLVGVGKDDDTLDMKFYIRTKENKLIELTSEKEGDYYKIALDNDRLPSFMDEFDFVYDVKFKDKNHSKKFKKDVKLLYDNEGEVKINSPSLTYEAIYKDSEKKYQLSLDYRRNGENIDQDVLEDQKPTEPTKPEAEGYSFEGWYLDQDYKTPFDFDRPMVEDTKIYAKWAKLFGVSYDFVSGTPDQALPESVKEILAKMQPVKAKEGEEVQAPTNKFEEIKSETGTWTFKGWDKNELKVSNNDEKFTGTWVFTKKEENHDQKTEDEEGKGGENPTTPQKPGEGKGETNPENPDQPQNPEEGKGGKTPDQPQKPEKGEGETHPENPNQPQKPKDGEGGKTPDQPQELGKGKGETNPENPNQPQNPKDSEGGETPDHPENPGKGEGEDKPVNPQNPKEGEEEIDPKNPDLPKLPEEGKDTDKPAKPEEEKKPEENQDQKNNQPNTSKPSPSLENKGSRTSLAKIDESSQLDIDRINSLIKHFDTKSPEETEKEPTTKVIRVNTDIYSPIPKGYKRIYFNPGKDGYLKYNPTFDFGQVIAFDIKQTLTFGQAKAQEKGLVIPTVIPRDKSLKFVGWYPRLQADEDFVEGINYQAIYEKIDDKTPLETKQAQEKSKPKQTKEKIVALKASKSLKNHDEPKKAKATGKKLKENKVETYENQAKPRKNQAWTKKKVSPKTGVTGTKLVGAILGISILGLFLSRKSKKK
ncbi:SHIRT domain-containing protein [uncultured Anaerococcus sp.]|uniref:SHIRT domain-containing protein n=1 Tax=uncultured Anaerococcus sp. TaxID=293428 RepID=UPI00288A4ADD|nr:SHIRT domain-containing protein [uncultured Anaerococcus sp.]